MYSLLFPSSISLAKTRMKKGLLALITILYFTLPFISIVAALSAIFCITLPFLINATMKENLWCRSYCPRASFLSVVGSTKKRYKKMPRMFTSGSLKKGLLIYLSLNVLFIIGSTLQVSSSAMEPMNYIRLWIVIKLFPIAQLIPLELPPWIMHLSYRLYSMMLSSTLLGVAFALLYRKRAWCGVCPVNSVITKLNEGYS